MATSHNFLLLVGAVLSVLPLLAEAQGYWVQYPSDCPYVCDAVNPSSPYSGYQTCYSQCNYCLLYWGCYSSFYPYFSTVNGALTYTSYSCTCYWPWWAWTILGVGLFVIVFICLPCCIIYFCCKGTMKFLNRNKDTEVVMAPEQDKPYMASATPAYPPPPEGYPPPPPEGYPPPPPPAQYAA